MEFEDILMEVGDWGPFQMSLLMVFGVSMSLVAPFTGMAVIFMVMTPDHHCYLPDNVNKSDNELQKSVTFVSNSSCRMSQITSTFTNGTFVNTTHETDCIYGWLYDKTYLDATAATKWDMVCEDSHYPSLMITLQNIGCLIGTPIYGALADRFGRKILVFALLFLASITDLISVFVDNLLIFAVLRAINGTVMPTMFNLPYILISELMAPKKRVLVNGVFNCVWMIGLCLIPLVAYVVRSWALLCVVNSILAALALLQWRFVPESASWLISQERYEDATKVLMSVGKMNDKCPNETQLLQKLKEYGEKNKQDKEEKMNFLSFIIKYPHLRKHFLIVTFGWLAFSIAYLGLHYNVINLGGNVFLNFFLLSLAEFPGNIIFWILMEKVGRRWSATMGFFGISFFCLFPLTGIEHSDIISSVIGKLIASGIYMVVDQQACELFPTVARSSGIGAGKAISLMVSLCTPFLAYLSLYGKTIPFVIISLVTFVGAVLSSFLPETLNTKLPQTFGDAENFGKDQKYISFKRNRPNEIRKHSTLNDHELVNHTASGQ